MSSRELLGQKWLLPLSAVGLLAVIGAISFILFWNACWPLSPIWVIQTSPWLEPKLKAWNRVIHGEFEQGVSEDAYDELEYAVDRLGPEGYQAFLPFLQSSDRDLRSAALTFLPLKPLSGVSPPQNVANELIRAAFDSDPEVSHLGCMGVCYLPLETAIPVWERMMRASPQIPQNARSQAFLYLVTRITGKDRSWILPYLSDANPDVRKSAVEALYTTRDSVTREAVERLKNDPDHNVRGYVERYLNFAPGQ